VSLEALCRGELESTLTGDVDLHDIADNIICGGWHENQDASLGNASLLPKAYIDGVIGDEVHHIGQVRRDKRKVRLLLRS